MMINSVVLVILGGACLVGGVACVIIACIPRPGRLDDTLALLDAEQPLGVAATAGTAALIGDPGSRVERWAAWAYRRLRLPLSPSTERLLALRGRSISDFFAGKIVLGMAGVAAPLVVTAADLAFGWGLGAVPAALSVLAGAAGYFWPDVELRRSEQAVHRDAEAAMSVFFDLVILERLGNASASQALRRAAGLCDVALFERIRGALDRAHLQQRPPWGELHALATDLQMPQLDDVADVLSLDEQGAALAGALRARVAELRQAHLAREKVAAQQDTEGMTIWMVIPVLAFALLFLAAPLLKVLAAG